MLPVIGRNLYVDRVYGHRASPQNSNEFPSDTVLCIFTSAAFVSLFSPHIVLFLSFFPFCHVRFFSSSNDETLFLSPERVNPDPIKWKPRHKIYVYIYTQRQSLASRLFAMRCFSSLPTREGILLAEVVNKANATCPGAAGNLQSSAIQFSRGGFQFCREEIL